MMEWNGANLGAHQSQTATADSLQKFEHEIHSDRQCNHCHHNESLTHILQGYSRKIRNLRTGDAFLDSSQYLKVASDMERELNNLRSLYHRELLALRRDYVAMKTGLEKDRLGESQLSLLLGNLQQKLDVLLDTNQHLFKELQHKEQAVAGKTKKLEALDLQEPESEIQTKEDPIVLDRLERVLAENTMLQNRIQQEELSRKELERKAKFLEHKLNFDHSSTIQHTKDMENELCTASAKILQLETQVRRLNSPEMAKQVDLQVDRVKQEANHKLYNYQHDTEAKFSQQLNLLQYKADADRTNFSKVRHENQKLLSCIEELNARIRSLQSELMHLDHQTVALEENLQIERDGNNRQIQALEGQIVEQQQILFGKMEELSQVNLQNLPVKVEAEALRSMVNEEGERCGMKLTFQSAQEGTSPKAANLAGNQTKSGAAYATYPLEIPGSPTNYIRKEQNSYLEEPDDMPTSKTVTDVKAINKENLGKGKEYFDLMFGEKGKKPGSCRFRPKSAPVRMSVPDREQRSYSSKLGPAEVYHISPDGRYITLHNSSNRDMEIEGYKLQQNVSGVPVCSFTFPRVVFKAGSFITVFSATCSPKLHQPPTQFIFFEQMRWGTGPECTTVLCKPDGKAAAWLNAPYKDSLRAKELESAHSEPKYLVTNVEPCNRIKHLMPNAEEKDVKIALGLKSFDQQAAGVARPNSSCRTEGQTSSQGRRRPRTAHSASAFRMGSAPMRKFLPAGF